MKTCVTVVLAAALTILWGGCFNFFHDLVPPDENRIISFEADGQRGGAQIGENSVDLTLGRGSDITAITPRIRVSPQAAVFPVTLDYILTAFPDIDLIKEMGALLTTGDLAAALFDLIKRTPDFSVPALTLPIDFSGPVTFFVLSGQGNVRQYTAQLAVDSGEPKLLHFAFSKYDNAELVTDSIARIGEQQKTITASAVYPMEMPGLTYALIPSFEIQGDKLQIDGIEIQSGIDAVQFSGSPGLQTKTITVTREGYSENYTLNLNVSEDPDTVRSITDFRFTRLDNPDIAANAVAAIVNTENTGTITVQVFYLGARPERLKARFISPGIVSVDGISQTGGRAEGDFVSPLTYRVVSRNGMYVRIYTVRVEFLSLGSETPRITSFRFSQAANHDLAQDTGGEIIEGNILIEAKYGGRPPETLVPEFSAGGLVSVNGVVQTSGISAHDFSRQIKYVVRHPLYPELKREYWVQVRLIKDSSSYSVISAFSFHPDENPGLAGEIDSKIDQRAGTITVFAPVGSGVSARTMIPRFAAQGQVTVNGDIQTSGSSGQVFGGPVVYTVTSANGSYRKDYTVQVREVKTTMYVNPAASGWNDGSSWEDAFVSLQSACEAAAAFPADVVKEIWITAGTYKPSAGGNREEYFMISPNTRYLGGFAGGETAKEQRAPAANVVIISGDLGGGVYSYQLFAGAFDAAGNALPLAGDAVFEHLRFTAARAQGPGSGERGRGGAGICAAFAGGADLTVTHCVFDGLENTGGGGAVCLGENNRGGVTLGSVKVTNTKAGNGGALYLNGGTGPLNFNGLTVEDIGNANGSGAVYIGGWAGDIQMLDSSFTSGNGYGISLAASGNTVMEGITVRDFTGCGISLAASGTVDMKRFTVQDVAGDGISLAGSGIVDMSGFTVQDVAGCGISLAGSGTVDMGGFTVKDIAGDGVRYSGGGGKVNVSGMDMADIGGNYGVYTSDIESVTVRDSFIAVSNKGTAIQVNGSSIRVYDTETNRGVTYSASGNANLAGLTVQNGDVSGTGSAGGSLTLSETKVQNGNINAAGFRDIIYSDITVPKGSVSAGSAANGSVTLSEAAVQNGNVTISGSSSSAVTFSAPVDVQNGRVSINGKDITVSGLTVNRFNGGSGLSVTSSGGTVGIKNTAIRNGENPTGNGGGLYLSNTGTSKMEVDNLTLENVKATGTGSSGGGMYIDSRGPVAVQNTRITGVAASNNGGGIGFTGSGSLTVEDSLIDGASGGGPGGGIYFDSSGTITVTHTEIKNVTAGGKGGGLYMYNPGTSKMEMDNLTLDNAKTTGTSGDGGGMYIYSRGPVAVQNTRITRVAASSSGGGIYFAGDGSLTVEDSLIDGASCRGAGGGLYFYSNGTVTVTGTEIKNVTATGYGGGIYVSGYGNLTLQGTTVDGASSGGSGGGLHFDSSGTMTVTDTEIKNVTTTGNGGGLYLSNTGTSRMEIDNLTLDNAKTTSGYGGGMYISSQSSSGPVAVQNSQITNVQASYVGGGIYFEGGGNLTLQGTTIDGAASGLDGGGLYFRSSGTVTVTGTKIKNATAGYNGGGIYFSGGGNLTLEHTIINGVSAGAVSGGVLGGLGGGIYFGYSENLTVIDTEIINGTAAGSGGGIFIRDSENLTVTDTKIKNVTATNSGSWIYFSSGGNLTLKKSLIEGASGDLAGGIYFGGLTLSVTDTEIKNVSANGNGSAIYFGGGQNLKLERTIINGTSSGQSGNSYMLYFATNILCSFRLLDCTFDFLGGNLGLLYAGSLYYGTSFFFDIDGCTVTNYTYTQGQPLMQLNNHVGTFRIRTNNSYNGTMLNSTLLNTLTASGLIKLENGAVITLYD